MPTAKHISRVRADAGRKGALARWGDAAARQSVPHATACLRCYPADAAELRRRAAASRRLPADVVAELLRNG